jgi:hypothetical protein
LQDSRSDFSGELGDRAFHVAARREKFSRYTFLGRRDFQGGLGAGVLQKTGTFVE